MPCGSQVVEVFTVLVPFAAAAVPDPLVGPALAYVGVEVSRDDQVAPMRHLRCALVQVSPELGNLFLASVVPWGIAAQEYHRGTLMLPAGF